MWLQMFTLYFGNTTKHQDIVVQLNEYMRSAQLPVALQKRLVSYYRYRYNDGYFRSSIINATLSGTAAQNDPSNPKFRKPQKGDRELLLQKPPGEGPRVQRAPR